MRLSLNRAWPPATVAAMCAIASCGDDGDMDGERRTSTPKTSTVGIDRATGTRAVAQATTVVDDPKSIRIRVSAAPRRRVTVAYGLTCTGAPSRSGAFDTTPPNTRGVRIPAGARECAISARAEILRGSGRVKVTLLASKR